MTNFRITFVFNNGQSLILNPSFTDEEYKDFLNSFVKNESIIIAEPDDENHRVQNIFISTKQVTYMRIREIEE